MQGRVTRSVQLFSNDVDEGVWLLSALATLHLPFLRQA
jgi:hypothetical protein